MSHSFRLTAGATSSRKHKQVAVAFWVFLTAIAVTATFWGTNQLCVLLAERMRQAQRQRYRPQVAYSDLWNKSRR